MEKKLVAYYNMPGDIVYEKQLLEEWDVQDIELREVKEEKTNDMVKTLKEYQGLVTEYTILSEETLMALPRLKIIALQSIGYDEIDVKAARRLQIDVTNAPGYCAEEVATHAMALLLGLTRQITLLDKSTHKGEWDAFTGSSMHRLSGKTAGLVSFGNIPQKMVPMLKGFGIRVLSYDPARDSYFMEEKGVMKCNTLEELLNQSDFVFLHTPLTAETEHMINREAIAQMKQKALLINVARGGLVDEEALIEALETGKISGAGLDVLEDEENRNTRLFQFPNVIITPHTAFLSEDSLKQSRRMALEQLVTKLSKDRTPDLVVNL